MEHFAVSGVRQGVTVPTTNLLLFRIPFDCTLLEVEADIGAQVPTGSAVIFDVRAGATLSTMTSIYSAPANRLTVAAGASGAQQTGLSVALVKGWVAGELIHYPAGGLVAPAFVAFTLDDGRPSGIRVVEADGAPDVLPGSQLIVGNGDRSE